MKRVISIALVLSIVLSLALGGASLSAFAAAKPGYKFSGELSKDGKTLDITVYISGVSDGVSAGMFVLKYDKSCLSTAAASLKGVGVEESSKYFFADKGYIGLDWYYATTQKPGAQYTKIAEIKFTVSKAFGSFGSVLTLCSDSAYLEEIGGYQSDGGALICNGASFYAQSAGALNIEYEYNGALVQKAELERLGGSDRFSTACLIAKEGWSGASSVVLVNAYSYADALAAVPLAAAMNAPILLTKADSVPSATLEQIKALKASKILIIGGETAVNAKVKNTLAKSYSVSRISGTNRYETSVAIAKELKKYGAFDELFLSYAYNYPDALSISPVAGLKGCPVLYVDKNGELSASVAAFIKSEEMSSVVVLGGVNAVSDNVKGSLKSAGVTSVTRLGGTSRYDTSKLIAEKYKGEFTGGAAAIATGTDFPDALAGGVLAARLKTPVLLVNKNSGVEAAAFISAAQYKKVYVFGGANAVSNQVAESVR